MISTLAAADVAIGLVAGLMALYEGFLSIGQEPARARTHRWAGLMSVVAAWECATQVVAYTTVDPAMAQLIVKLQYVGYAALGVCGAEFTAAVTRRRYLPGWSTFALGGGLALMGLTDQVVPPTARHLHLSLLDHPMLLPSATHLTDVFYVVMLSWCGFTTWWLLRWAQPTSARLVFGAGFGAWTLAALVDAASTAALIPLPPMFFLEYGALFLALSLVVADVGHYHSLLQRSEKLLARTDESLWALVENIPLPALAHRGGKIVLANQALASLLGYPGPSVLEGQSLMVLAHPDDLAIARTRIATLDTATQPQPLLEERLRRADGTYVLCEVVAVPVTYHGEKTTVSMGIDVTERRELTARMMRMDRMIAVGTLAAGVAHEINNPLAYVSANLDFAAEELAHLPGGADSPRHAEVLSALKEGRQGAERVRRIVADLSSLSRASDERMELVDLNAAVESATNVVQNEVKHRAQMVKELGAVPRVLSNAARLGQVFVNLLVNAAQAIPLGRAQQNQVCVRTRMNEAGSAVLEVSDTGSGIAPEHRARVFDAFFTTKPVGQGTGLGLAICQSIVRASGGELTFETEVGKGTTFRVVLPAATSTTSPLPQRPPEMPLTVPRARVLVIDDEPLVGAAMARVLGHSHQVTTLQSAREALSRLTSGETFDVVFCDVMMPDFTGPQLFAALKEQRPDLLSRVVFVTGGVFSPEAQALLSENPNLTLEKPLDLAMLQRAIASVTQPPQ